MADLFYKSLKSGKISSIIQETSLLYNNNNNNNNNQLYLTRVTRDSTSTEKLVALKLNCKTKIK